MVCIGDLWYFHGYSCNMDTWVSQFLEMTNCSEMYGGLETVVYPTGVANLKPAIAFVLRYDRPRRLNVATIAISESDCAAFMRRDQNLHDTCHISVGRARKLCNLLVSLETGPSRT